MFVKICGITVPEDGVAVAQAGADAIGLNFVETSRRRVDVDVARRIADAVRGEVLLVGIFRHHLAREVRDAVDQVGLDAAQLHDADDSLLAEVRPHVPALIEAVSVGEPSLPVPMRSDADILMLDAPVPGAGVPFDWSLVGDLTSRHRVLLAGGLRPDTVAQAIAAVHPWGVDVASGVESEPGRKDHEAVRAFVTAARAADPTGSATDHPPLRSREQA